MSIPPPYAPYTPRTSIAPALDTEVKLISNTRDRTRYDALSEIYAILVSLDFLERAYLRDTVSHEEYTPTCLRLLAQYNGILNTFDLEKEEGGLDGFRKNYGVAAEHAVKRISVGVPATVEHGMEQGSATGASAKAVAEATGVSIKELIKCWIMKANLNLIEFHYMYGCIEAKLQIES